MVYLTPLPPAFHPEGLGSDTKADDQVVQHHPGADGRQAGGLRPRAHREGGERRRVLRQPTLVQIFSSSMGPSLLFPPQADQARQHGARVYCVGIKDFDEQQVRELWW